MSTDNANTAQGTTIAFGSNGAIGCVRSCQLPELTLEKIDASCLEDTDFMKYISGDLTDPGDLVIEAVFDTAEDLPEMGKVDDVTVTFPLADEVTNDTPATLTGSAFITSTGLPNLAINELMVITLTISFDGYTGPAFTKEAATP